MIAIVVGVVTAVAAAVDTVRAELSPRQLTPRTRMSVPCRWHVPAFAGSQRQLASVPSVQDVLLQRSGQESTVGDKVGKALGDVVGASVGNDGVGDVVGSGVVGERVGERVGTEVVGERVGTEVVGDADGDRVGERVGAVDGDADGDHVGERVGEVDGDADGNPGHVGAPLGFWGTAPVHPMSSSAN